MSEHEREGTAGSGPDSAPAPDPELEKRLRRASPSPPFPGERIQARVQGSLEAQGPELWRSGEQVRRPTGGPKGGPFAPVGGHLGRRPGGRSGGPPGRGSEGRRALTAALVAAAAVLVFVAGVEYGRGTAAAPGPGADDATSAPAAVADQGLDPALDSGLDHALRIQWAGSRWVATLARFSREAAEVDDATRRAAREVATTIFYAAALELLMEAGEDELMETIAWLAHTRREALQPTDAHPAAGEVSRAGHDDTLRGSP